MSGRLCASCEDTPTGTLAGKEGSGIVPRNVSSNARGRSPSSSANAFSSALRRLFSSGNKARTDDSIRYRPHENLKGVGNHQRHCSTDHHDHQVQPRAGALPKARRTGNADCTDGDQRMDHDVDRANDTANQKLSCHTCSKPKF